MFWRCRWNAIRLAIALFLLWAVVADTGARLARRQLALLPDFDFAGEVRYLQAAGRYGEALSVADAGIESLSDDSATVGDASRTVDADVAGREELIALRAGVERERASWMRRVRDAGVGAMTGSVGASGDASLERLSGAVAADLFVVGDVRDLLIQGGRYAVDGESDEVIVALSALGLATTLAPQVDWVPALLKVARKAGSMSRGLQEFLVGAVKSRKAGAVESLAGDVGAMARHSSPAAAVRLLRYVDDPTDAARLARFLERHSKGSRGTFALHVAGDEGAALLKAAEGAGAGGRGVLTTGDALVKAATKGRSGVRWLSTPGARAFLRPHPLIGLTKGVWKGNVQMLVQRGLDAAGPRAWWLVPLLAAWVVVEVALLIGTLSGVHERRRRHSASTGA